MVSRQEILDLIRSDEDTKKAFQVLVMVVENNYPFFRDAEKEVLERMHEKGCLDLEQVQGFICNMYSNEKSAGRLFKPVGTGGIRI